MEDFAMSTGSTKEKDFVKRKKKKEKERKREREKET